MSFVWFSWPHEQTTIVGPYQMNLNSNRVQFQNLSWTLPTPKPVQKMFVLSGYGAIDFGECLRLLVKAHPNNLALRKMASEELETCNLQFEDYNRRGDHSEYVWHFIKKYNLYELVPKEVFEHGELYLEKVRSLPLEVRMMSIVSREQDLSDPFRKLLLSNADGWKLPGLAPGKYYWEEHVVLDSQEGGHADLLSEFEVTDAVEPWYKHRVDMYRCIPELFR